MVDALQLFNSGTLSQELIHPHDRKALYARSLISHFQRDHVFVAGALRELRRHRRHLEDLLSQKGPWANHEAGAIRLEDAVLIDYDGLSHPAAFQQLWGDVEPYRNQIMGLTEGLASAEQLALEAGLRAPWAAPMVLGAWLRHLVRRRILPPGLRRHSFRLWPSGPRTVHQAPPTIVIEYYWDPESETRDAARATIMKHVDAKLDETISSYKAEGYERVNARKVRRDVEATYLRISEPERWSWRKLSARHRPLSTSGVRSAVGRVLALLEIEPPAKGPGRRPRVRPLPD